MAVFARCIPCIHGLRKCNFIAAVAQRATSGTVIAFAAICDIDQDVFFSVSKVCVTIIIIDLFVIGLFVLIRVVIGVGIIIVIFVVICNVFVVLWVWECFWFSGFLEFLNLFFQRSDRIQLFVQAALLIRDLLLVRSASDQVSGNERKDNRCNEEELPEILDRKSVV